MIFAASFSFLAAITAPSATEVQTEIVVIGERLQTWQGKYKIRGEQMKCSTRRSSGDREIDAIGCQAFKTCATELMPRLIASDAKNLDNKTRQSMKQLIKQDLSSCVTEQRKALIADLARKRTQKN